MDKETQISEEDFISYLEIQKSGVINMFDAKTGCEISGLDRETWIGIMKNYSILKELYKDAYDEVFDQKIDI